MVKAMPEPYKHSKTGVYWYRQRCPRDVALAAKGKRATIDIAGESRRLLIGDGLKVSLRTKDHREAKHRARDVQSQFDLVWETFREKDLTLTLKQAVALAGEVYRDFVQSLEDNPGSPELWRRVRGLNADAFQSRPRRRLTIREAYDHPLEPRFGDFVDVVLDRHRLRITEASREKLLVQVAVALDEVAKLLERRALGDYSPDEYVKRFPAFERPAPFPKEVRPSRKGITFDEIISAEAKHREIGLGAKAKPFPPATPRKYRAFAAEFTAYRGEAGAIAETVTADELTGWITSMLTNGQKARTVNLKAGGIKTILRWGTARFRDNARLSAVATEIEGVELPGFEKKPSDITAIRPDEAVQVLRAARKETDPRTRWLPWMCAYTGARINELSPLEKEDFVEVEGYWFIKIHSTGKRSLKNKNAERYIPVHPQLAEEGLLQFVERSASGRLFKPGASDKVQEWFRHPRGANIQREGVAPSHGWRHLFEDLCIRDGVSDSAKKYITGRAKGSSDEDYGKTLVRLPGLAREIAKIVPFGIE